MISLLAINSLFTDAEISQKFLSELKNWCCLKYYPKLSNSSDIQSDLVILLVFINVLDRSRIHLRAIKVVAVNTDIFSQLGHYIAAANKSDNSVFYVLETV